MKKKVYLFMMLVFALGWQACQKESTILNQTKSHNALELRSNGCTPTTWDLIAGQTHDVGTLTVTNDETNVYITYSLDDPDYPDACLGQVHAWIGTSLTYVDGGGSSRPAPGQMCNVPGGECAYATGQKSITITIPLSDIGITDIDLVCNSPIYVVAHAEVDLDCDPNTDGHETAFGGPTSGPGKAWWFYGQYSLCCPTDDPNLCLDHETAWAKGSRYVTKGNWAMYVPYSGSAKTVDLIAGQKIDIGDVTISAPDINGKVTISINITAADWSLADVDEPIKIQDYASAPSGNPAPGLFAYKSSTSPVIVPANNFYGIHLDVAKLIPCP